jgi:hypothetical protein
MFHSPAVAIPTFGIKRYIFALEKKIQASKPLATRALQSRESNQLFKAFLDRILKMTFL